MLQAIAIGLGATLMMDLWNLFLKRALSIPSLDYCLLGRWLRHMPSGTFRHQSIMSAAPRSLECQVGWVAHYSIGVTLALVFVALSGGAWLAHPTVAPALIFGIGTVAFPFFVLQPALGLGVASSLAASPVRARLKSLVTHLVFGLGLYASAIVMARANP